MENQDALNGLRQKDDRAAGPFDGYRVGLLETPVRISDLGVGGCFVNSTHERREGARVVVKIDLPHEGLVAVNAETAGSLPGLGFAIRFVDVDAETGRRLSRAVDQSQRRHARISKAPKPF